MLGAAESPALELPMSSLLPGSGPDSRVPGSGLDGRGQGLGPDARAPGSGPAGRVSVAELRGPPVLSALLFPRYQQELRLRNYSPRTIDSYSACLRRYVASDDPPHLGSAA